MSVRRVSRWVLCAVLATAVVGSGSGCGGMRWVGTPNNADRGSYVAAGFGFESLKGGTLAVGGVVLRDGAPLDEFCGLEYSRRELDYELQADLWSPALNAAVLSLSPAVDIRLWHAVRASVPPEAIEAAHARIAHGGLLSPAILGEWAASLPGVDYLALARIENTWIDGTGQSDWSLAEGLGRVAVVTLEVYDLAAETSVWSAVVQKHVGGRMVAPAEATDEGDARSGKRPVGADVDRTTKAAPTLDDALDDALEAAVTKLRGT